MELDVALRKGFRLGDWEIRPIEGLVVGPQGSRHLQPKTIDVLVCLAASHGQVLTRDELINRVWGTNAVSDEPLTRCIHEIRRGLDDNREQPTYIQTIPKRGYRLLVAAEELEAAQEQPPATRVPQDNLFWQVTRQRVLWVGALYAGLAWAFVQLARYAEQQAGADLLPPVWLMPALVVILLLGFPVAIFFAWVKQLKIDDKAPAARFPGLLPLLWSRRGIDLVLVTLVMSALAGLAFDLGPPNGARATSFNNYSIAVIPFDSGHEQGEENWLGEGLADDLRKRLDLYEYLTVSGREVSFRDSLQQLDAQQIGRELDVQYLLQGWVIRGTDTAAANGGRIRVRARLLDALTGFEIWSQAFNRDAPALFEIQREISTQIAAALGLSGSAREELQADTTTVVDMAAYDDYLRGANQLRIAASAESAAIAASYFREAVAADPRMSMARNSLCQALVKEFELELDNSARLFGEASSACTEALLQSPDSPEAHLVLADFYRVTDDQRQAVEEYEWVKSRHPENVDAWLGLARAFTTMGSSSEAGQSYRAALKLQPDHADALEAYAGFLIAEGGYLDALDVTRKLVKLDRERVVAYEYLASALFMTGSFDASIQASRQVISRAPGRLSAVINIAQNHYHLERYGRAIDIYQQAARLLPEDHGVMGMLATVYAQLDEDEAAMQSERAFVRARYLASRQLELGSTDAITTASLAYYCAALDDPECASRYLGRALTLASDSYRVHYIAALVHAEAGNTGAASAAMEQAISMGYPRILVLTDPQLAGVWTERRFATSELSMLFRGEY